jgi:hypothetical protein
MKKPTLVVEKKSYDQLIKDIFIVEKTIKRGIQIDTSERKFVTKQTNDRLKQMTVSLFCG